MRPAGHAWASVSFSRRGIGECLSRHPTCLQHTEMDHFLEALSANLLITREYLRAGVLVSLLSVWVLVALFCYLNRYTKRRYFTMWTAAWLFYALWMTLSFGMAGEENKRFLLML